MRKFVLILSIVGFSLLISGINTLVEPLLTHDGSGISTTGTIRVPELHPQPTAVANPSLPLTQLIGFASILVGICVLIKSFVQSRKS